MLSIHPPFDAQAPAEPLFSVDDLSNYTAAAPGPADATSHVLSIPPLTTDASEADAWFRRLSPRDADGRTIIVYGVYRFYAADIAVIGPTVVGILLKVRLNLYWAPVAVSELYTLDIACKCMVRPAGGRVCEAFSCS